MLLFAISSLGDYSRMGDVAASYLQGFKYSRPIPIDQLRNFFTVRN